MYGFYFLSAFYQFTLYFKNIMTYQFCNCYFVTIQSKEGLQEVWESSAFYDLHVFNPTGTCIKEIVIKILIFTSVQYFPY